jgi:hypothetical protein
LLGHVVTFGEQVRSEAAQTALVGLADERLLQHAAQLAQLRIVLFVSTVHLTIQRYIHTTILR